MRPVALANAGVAARAAAAGFAGFVSGVSLPGGVDRDAANFGRLNLRHALVWRASSAAQCDDWRREYPAFHRDWDCRHPVDESVKCQGATRVMLFIRHGQYQTRGGPGYGRLTDLGREQAKMTGQHIVARMRADPVLKQSMFKLTSSALDRAIETADIIEREIVEELEWVNATPEELGVDTVVRIAGDLGGGFLELVISELPSDSVTITNPENLLQPAIEIRRGSRLRVEHSSVDVSGVTPLSLVPLSSIVNAKTRVAVHQTLQDVKRPDARFEEWHCSGCKAEWPLGDVHWSDEAETTGLGFCDACFRAGPSHRKLKPGDTFARKSEGVMQPRFRMPNDKNLNEAQVDTASVLAPSDPLFEEYGQMNAEILRDHAVVEAAFKSHMHRSVNHKTLKRKDRSDTISLNFVTPSGEQHTRHWTASECERFVIGEEGICSWIFDEDAKTHVYGQYTLQRVGKEDVSGRSSAEMRETIMKEAKVIAAKKPGKQVEIIVAHQNVIRYMFLKAMQFDTKAWLNLGGSNCTMTQLRLTRNGDAICDFFADHGSMLPVSHYTFNSQSDV